MRRPRATQNEKRMRLAQFESNVKLICDIFNWIVLEKKDTKQLVK